ncbi:MAG: hypothetical protein LUD44_04905 [Firmicutes bacterium]|nr:hypothetical protein [Bacillota bacterium]
MNDEEKKDNTEAVSDKKFFEKSSPREVLFEILHIILKNEPLLIDGMGIAVAVLATVSVKTALYVAMTTIIASVSATALTSAVSDFTGRVGKTVVFISAELCVFSIFYAIASVLLADVLSDAGTALILSAVSTFVISCFPDEEEKLSGEVIRTLKRSACYAFSLLVISLLRFLFAGAALMSTPAGALLVMGFLSALISFVRTKNTVKPENTDDIDDIKEEEHGAE